MSDPIRLTVLAPNFTRVDLPGVSVWFSYSTPVGYHYSGDRGPVVRSNEWGPTTGKHLGAIDGGSKEAKASRVSGPDFLSGLELPLSLGASRAAQGEAV